MHIGLIGFQVCIPALLGSTDIASVKITVRQFAFFRINFRRTRRAEGMERVEWRPLFRKLLC